MFVLMCITLNQDIMGLQLFLKYYRSMIVFSIMVVHFQGSSLVIRTLKRSRIVDSVKRPSLFILDKATVALKTIACQRIMTKSCLASESTTMLLLLGGFGISKAEGRGSIGLATVE